MNKGEGTRERLAYVLRSGDIFLRARGDQRLSTRGSWIGSLRKRDRGSRGGARGRKGGGGGSLRGGTRGNVFHRRVEVKLCGEVAREAVGGGRLDDGGRGGGRGGTIGDSGLRGTAVERKALLGGGARN